MAKPDNIEKQNQMKRNVSLLPVDDSQARFCEVNGNGEDKNKASESCV